MLGVNLFGHLRCRHSVWRISSRKSLNITLLYNKGTKKGWVIMVQMGLHNWDNTTLTPSLPPSLPPSIPLSRPPP